MRINFLLCLVITALAAAGRPATASGLVMASGKLTVTLSRATGQIVNITENGNGAILAESEDRYDFNDRPSSESRDVVISEKTGINIATFDCVNRDLGLRISKTYRLNGEVLEKEIRCTSDLTETQLLRVSSRSTIRPSLYPSGYFYLPTDDGYKVTGVPLFSGLEVKSPTPWAFSRGAFVYYFPKKDRVFTHYRYKVNGGFLYGEPEQGIESKLIPGGAVTALAACFVGRGSPLSVVSRYVLIDGDPRDYTMHVISQPPYLEHRNDKVTQWFKKVRMFNEISKALYEVRESVGNEALSMLKLLRDDEYLIYNFGPWSMSGDYPYKGEVRYQTYNDNKWSAPIPVEKLKEDIAWLKSLSPRIKVGGYVFLSPAKGTDPYENRKDWLLYDKQGNTLDSGDGFEGGAQADFSTGYADYSLDQMRNMVKTLGFDYIHVDSGPNERINWSTRRVVQSRFPARVYEELSKFLPANNAAMVQNVAPMVNLFAQGAYCEFLQTARWEKKDWRILAVPGYLACLARTVRPGTWLNLVFGYDGEYGRRNAVSGMRGGIRVPYRWWRDVSWNLTCERVVDELLETRLCDARVHPSWWRLETDKLEAEALQKGDGVIIPLMLHRGNACDQTIRLNTGIIGFRKDRLVFGFDLKLSPAQSVDMFKPVPWKMDYMELVDFQVGKQRGPNYAHSISMEPHTNYYHVVTQVPAWVYSYNGFRTSLILPEIRGVKISGRLQPGARSYRLVVRNANKRAEIMAYAPANWRQAAVMVNGRGVNATTITAFGKRLLLIELPKGRSDVVVSEASGGVSATTAYTNPQADAWREAAERIIYGNLTHRAYTEAGMSCLGLREIAPGGGSAGLFVYPNEKAGGFSVKLKGDNSGAVLVVYLMAGSYMQYDKRDWKYEIKDDFLGWKQFDVYRESMSPTSAGKTWGEVARIDVAVFPAVGMEMNIADLHLLPARKGDFQEEAAASAAPAIDGMSADAGWKNSPVARRIAASRASAAPTIDGSSTDACWKDAPVASNFYAYQREGFSDSKTNAQICCDDQNLYVLVENVEPIDELGTPVPRDSEIWRNDHLELFVHPDREKMDWYQILVDPAGSTLDISYGKLGSDFGWNGDIELKTALNWKVSWTAEFRIPFATLGKTPKKGDVWGINFGRTDMSGELSNWATHGEWLDSDGFGEVVFE